MAPPPLQFQAIHARVFLKPEGTPVSHGNGFVLSPSTNFVITAAHVVRGATAIRVLARAQDGEIVSLDAVNLRVSISLDLAAIQLRQRILQIIDPLVVGDPEGAMPVQLHAYTDETAWENDDLTVQDAIGTTSGNALIYNRNLGARGHSGGAVVLAGSNKIVGVHVGEPNGGLSQATLCNPAIILDLLT
jgi:hypothetical protein